MRDFGVQMARWQSHIGGYLEFSQVGKTTVGGTSRLDRCVKRGEMMLRRKKMWKTTQHLNENYQSPRKMGHRGIYKIWKQVKTLKNTGLF